MSKYGHLFDSRLSDEDIGFDSLFVDVNDENIHLAIPILLKIAGNEVLKAKLKEYCERMMFDITAIEAGVHPDPQTSTRN